MDQEHQPLEAVRAAIHQAHQAIARASYDEAIATFTACLPALRAHLGPGHPEVEELVDDLAAAREMREVYAFGQEVGYRGWTTGGKVPGGDGSPG